MRHYKLFFFALAATLYLACPAIAGATPQNTPPVQTTTPPGNNSPLVQPSSLSGAEDKSYLSFASDAAGSKMFNFIPLPSVNLNVLAITSLKIPRAIYSFSLRTKFDGTGTYVAPEFNYMDVKSGVEAGIQDLTVFQGGRVLTGPGLSLRLDLSPSRIEWVKSHKKYSDVVDRTVQTTQQERTELLQKQAVPDGLAPLSPGVQADALKKAQEADKQRFRQAVLPSFSQFLDDFFGSARKLRMSAFLTNQWLDSAQLATAGLSISQVVPARHYNHQMTQVWGVVPRIAVQGLFQGLSGSEAAQFRLPRSTNAVRTSLGLALQDNIPHLIYDKKNPDGTYSAMPQIARWRFQVGVEYVYRNVVDQNESYGLYTRFRNLKEHSEFSLSLSRTSYKDLQLGVGFIMTTDWKKHPPREKNSTPGS